MLVLAVTSTGVLVWHFATAAPSSVGNTTVTPSWASGPCTWVVSNNTSSQPEAHAMIGGLSVGQGDNKIGTAHQDMGAFLNPLVASDTTFCFESNQFMFSTTFLLAGALHDIVLEGIGESGQLGYGPNLGSDGPTFTLACSSNVDLLQVGDNSGQAPGGYSIANVYIAGITFEGQKSCNTSGDCVHGISWSGGGMQDSTLHNCPSNGLELAASSKGGVSAGCCLSIRANTFEFINLDGISENGNVYDFIYSNHFEQAGHSCINLISKRQNVGPDNNFLQCGFNSLPGTEYPGVFVQSQYNDVHDNYFENVEFDCIKVNGQSNIIAHNRMDACGQCNVGGCGANYSGVKIKFQNETVTGNIFLNDYQPGAGDMHAGVEENTAGATRDIISFNQVVGCLSSCSASNAYITTATANSTWFGNYPQPSVSALTPGSSPYNNPNPFTEILIVTTVNGATALVCNGAAMGNPTLGMSCTLRTGQKLTYATANPTFELQPQ